MVKAFDSQPRLITHEVCRTHCPGAVEWAGSVSLLGDIKGSTVLEKSHYVGVRVLSH